MTSFALFVPEGRLLNLAALSPADYKLITGLHGNIRHGDGILLCKETGGDPEMHVRRSPDGTRFWAVHFAGGAHGTHDIRPESEEHRRGKDYWVRAFDTAGFTAVREVSTNNRTRLDAAAFGGAVDTGVEVQLYTPRPGEVKRRTTQSMRATATTGAAPRLLPSGILPVWFSPSIGRLTWHYTAPTILAQDRDWGMLPGPRSDRRRWCAADHRGALPG